MSIAGDTFYDKTAATLGILEVLFTIITTAKDPLNHDAYDDEETMSTPGCLTAVLRPRLQIFMQYQAHDPESFFPLIVFFHPPIKLLILFFIGGPVSSSLRGDGDRFF